MGKSIATAAIKIALESGFKALGINRIEAIVDPENIASQIALIKAGLVCKGLAKNYTFFKGSLKSRYVYAKALK